MLQYRVTKYDPNFRDPAGRYTREEWTSVSDIGRSFGGVVLTRESYRRVENAYAAVAESFLRESGMSSMVVVGLEHHDSPMLPFRDGSTLGLEQLSEVIRRLLREEFWCLLQGAEGFLHVGYDYYMYLGVPSLCPGSHELAIRLGLFIEEFDSPYVNLKDGGAD